MPRQPDGPASRTVEKMALQLAKQIKQVMEDSSVSYAELGRRVGKTHQEMLVLLNWRTGHVPSLTDLARVIDALGYRLIVGENLELKRRHDHK